LMSHKAIDLIQEGDILVIDVGGYTGSAVGGYLMSRKMISKKASGVVVDGAWRDLKEITEHRFPVFARAWTPSGPHKDLPGSVNVPISCGGVVVKPCDVIVGDDDGLVVIPFESLTDILVKAAEIHEKEKAIMADTRKEIIEAPSPYTTDERLRKMGIKIV
jgi:4-hydroxy-4-methyl-2-oxoglutarate aldolase